MASSHQSVSDYTLYVNDFQTLDNLGSVKVVLPSILTLRD